MLGLQAPGYLVVDPDSDAKREYIFYAALGASSLDNVTRGLAGSAAGAQAHDSGVRIRAVPVHQWLDDLWDGIEDNATALSNHEVNADPHPVYLLQLEADALYVELTGDAMTGVLNMQGNAVSNLPTGGAGGDAASVTYADGLLGTHEGAADPHPQYLLVDGSKAMTGDLNMGNTLKIVNLANPTLAQDAATKFYVDGLGPFLPLAGGTMLGNLDMGGLLLLNPADPTDDVHVGDRDFNDARYALDAEGVTGGDVHNHLGGDGAQIVHSSIGSVGSSDHHVRFSDANAVSAVSAADDYVRLGGDQMSGPLTIISTSVVAKFYRQTATATAGITSWSSNVGGVDTQVAIVEADGDFNKISDVSIKENIRDAESMLDKILGLRIRRYDMKNGAGFDKLGVVAQEAELVAPEIIVEHDLKMVSPNTLLFMLTKAVQELAAKATA